MPLRKQDASFSFMLHARAGIRPIKSEYPYKAPLFTVVLASADLEATLSDLMHKKVRVISAVKDL